MAQVGYTKINFPKRERSEAEIAREKFLDKEYNEYLQTLANEKPGYQKPGAGKALQDVLTAAQTPEEQGGGIAGGILAGLRGAKDFVDSAEFQGIRAGLEGNRQAQNVILDRLGQAEQQEAAGAAAAAQAEEKRKQDVIAAFERMRKMEDPFEMEQFKGEMKEYGAEKERDFKSKEAQKQRAQDRTMQKSKYDLALRNDLALLQNKQEFEISKKETGIDLEPMSSNEATNFANTRAAARQAQVLLKYDKVPNPLDRVAYKEWLTAQKELGNAVGRMYSGGAIGEDEWKLFNKMLPERTDPPEIAQKKVNELQKILTDKITLVDPTGGYSKMLDKSQRIMTVGSDQPLRTSDVETSIKFKGTDGTGYEKAQDAEALRWATQNPNDPRAEQIKARISQKYTGGARGF